MAQNPFLDLVPGGQEEIPGAVTVGTPRPRTPPPQTPAQEAIDVGRAAQVPLDTRKAAADAEKAELEVAEAKRKEAMRGDPKSQLASQRYGATSLLEQIQNIRDMASGWTTGTIGSLTRSRGPGGLPADNLAGAIAPLQANLAFDRLQEMRNNSPTGGALGSITERELYLLQSTVGNLDPNLGEETFLKQLQQVEDHYQRYILSLDGIDPDSVSPEDRAAYFKKGDGASGLSRAEGGQIQFKDDAPDEPAKQEMLPDQIRKYDEFMRANPNATAQQIREFGDSIGAPVNNAEEIVKYRDDPARSAVPLEQRIRSATDAIYGIPQETLDQKEQQDRQRGTGGTDELLTQSATLGLSDEAAGIGNSLYNMFSAPFTDRPLDVLGSYQSGRDAERLRIRDAREGLGAFGTAVEIGGGLLSGRPGGVAGVPGLWNQVRQGARGGAEAGALAGFGYGEGVEGSGVGAVTGGLGGALVGAGIPLALAGVQGGVRGAVNAFRDPRETATRFVTRSLLDDGTTPRNAATLLEERSARGGDPMLADTGENSRNLLAGVTRQPGESRKIGLDAVTARQTGMRDGAPAGHGQAERVVESMEKTLGPTSNPYEMSKSLLDEAKTAAGPLYEASYARPGAGAFATRIEDLLARPSMKRAYAKAHRIASEEGRDPTSLGFDLDQAGEVILTRVPSWQTLDYIKRGMDDVIEGYRDGTTGRLNLDTEGRAVNNTLRTFLSRIDKANPEYAAARAAYSGPVRAKAALDRGTNALRADADDIAEQIADLTPNELEHYKVGFRNAMRKAVLSQPDGANSVNKLIGNPRSRDAMEKLFGGSEGYGQFLASLADEQAAFQTYARTATGSPTSLNQNIDQAVSNEGMTNAGLEVMTQGSGIGLFRSIVRAMAKRKGDPASSISGGDRGDRIRAEISKILTGVDPAIVREIMVQANRVAAAERRTAGREYRGNVRSGARGGQLIGEAAAPTDDRYEPRR